MQDKHRTRRSRHQASGPASAKTLPDSRHTLWLDMHHDNKELRSGRTLAPCPFEELGDGINKVGYHLGTEKHTTNNEYEYLAFTHTTLCLSHAMFGLVVLDHCKSIASRSLFHRPLSLLSAFSSRVPLPSTRGVHQEHPSMSGRRQTAGNFIWSAVLR